MNIQYNYEFEEKKLTHYILGYLVFISTFFIAIKSCEFNIIISLILFLTLTIISNIYIFNVKKYSLFKYDILFFIGTNYIFSSILLYKLLVNIYQNKGHELINFIVYFLIFFEVINYLIGIFKISNMRILKGLKVFFIIVFYIFIILFIIVTFTYIFINISSLSIKTYIASSYLNNMKIEDYILLSAQNCFGGFQNEIVVNGLILKIILVIEKIIFHIINIFTLAILIGSYCTQKRR